MMERLNVPFAVLVVALVAIFSSSTWATTGKSLSPLIYFVVVVIALLVCVYAEVVKGQGFQETRPASFFFPSLFF